MFLAVLKAGVLQPLDPLPPTLRDGDVVQVEMTERTAADPAFTGNDDFANLAADWGPDDPADHERLQGALDEQRRTAKEQMRLQMGLR